MPSFSTEQAKTVIHVALMLLRGQLAIFSQFPSQVWARFWTLWGLALGRGLGVSSNFWVTLRVSLTCQVSLTCNFSLPLPVAVIDGLYELTEIQQVTGRSWCTISFLMQWASIMTCSRLGPEPVPAPTQPQTNPRHFIADAPRIASHHVTHSHHVHPQTRTSASWHMQPPVVHAVFLACPRVHCVV